MAGAYLESPYLDSPSAIWLRGNLHTHTTRSDGAASPQAMIDRYAALGYDFIQLSDHDTLGRTDGLDGRGMTLLCGAEITGCSGHILDVGARRVVGSAASQQAQIDDIVATSGFPVLCHPNWEEDYDHYPYPLLAELNNYAGIEIFNGVCIDLAGNHLATDKWDRLLTLGKKAWGFAHDDAHAIEQTGRGWNVVRSADRSPEAILAALKSGSFYASCGVRIESIAVEGPVLKIVAPNADRMAVYGQYGSRLRLSDGPELAFDAGEVDSAYIRVECLGRGGAVAWTQPFYIRNGRIEKFREFLAKMGATQKPVLKALRADRAPRLTGKLDDPLWRQAPAHTFFLNIKSGELCPVATGLRCVASGDKLYFGLRCEEPLLEQMKLTVTHDGEGNIWTNDSVELFLDVEGAKTSYYQMVVNADGFTYIAARGARQSGPVRLVCKAGRWEQGGTRGWSAELVVPLAELGVAPPPAGTQWPFHCCRNRQPVKASYVWSWVGSSNHNTQAYGSLEL